MDIEPRSCTELLPATLAAEATVVSGQITPDWDSLQANHMSTSSKPDNLICSF